MSAAPVRLSWRRSSLELISGRLRYFMHISDAHGFVVDEEGTELPDDAAARAEAIAAARDVMAGDCATATGPYLLFHRGRGRSPQAPVHPNIC